MENKETIIKELAVIWKEALESDEDIASDVPFFELGGNSLLASVVSEEINKKYEIDFEIKNVYEYPTVAEQADFIAGKLAEKE